MLRGVEFGFEFRWSLLPWRPPPRISKRHKSVVETFERLGGSRLALRQEGRGIDARVRHLADRPVSRKAALASTITPLRLPTSIEAERPRRRRRGRGSRVERQGRGPGRRGGHGSVQSPGGDKVKDRVGGKVKDRVECKVEAGSEKRSKLGRKKVKGLFGNKVKIGSETRSKSSRRQGRIRVG